MDCEDFLEECKGECCGCAPIPASTWWKNQDKVVTKPSRVIAAPAYEGESQVIPHTEKGKCVFQRDDYRCNIYEDRPNICRKFGNEEHHFLICLYQRKDGSRRFKRERERLLKKLAKKQKKQLHKIAKYVEDVKEING